MSGAHFDNVIDLAAARHARSGGVERVRPRGERRGSPATFRVRVELTETPVWRLIELPSDLFLDRVHDVIQLAMGWTDCHLHQFANGELFDPGVELYLMASSVDDGLDGVPETDVRLDEVLAQPGDRLHYEYDFGDSWHHVLTVVEVVPPADAAATCVDGAMACPPEDCGGIGGYAELVEAVRSPSNARNVELRAWAGDWEAERFSVGPANAALATWASVQLLPPVVQAFIDRARDEQVHEQLVEIALSARLHETVSVDPDEAAAMVQPFRWMLERVGADGLPLTAAGYLRPIDVVAAVTELGLSDELPGSTLTKSRSESDAPPVWHLREAAQQLGLLRKAKGRVSVTAVGRKVRDHPLALWSHLAARLPYGSEFERDAGTIELLLVAADHPLDVQFSGRVLESLGWRYDDGRPIDHGSARRAAHGTTAVLRRLGAVAPSWPLGSTARHPEAGRAFARRALAAPLASG